MVQLKLMEDKMAQQNIYDNEVFFEGYKKIRDNKINANNLFEIPALFSMLPDIKNKRVLDLGCGFGEHCKRFIDCGAKKVVGIDISEKMLEVARNENSDPNIIYINMPMEKIAELNEQFDIVVSSLAFHYIEDFEGVVRDIYNMLDTEGIFIFLEETDGLETSWAIRYILILRIMVSRVKESPYGLLIMSKNTIELSRQS